MASPTSASPSSSACFMATSSSMRASARRVAKSLLESGNGLLDRHDIAPDFLNEQTTAAAPVESPKKVEKSQNLEESIYADDWTVMRDSQDAAPYFGDECAPIFHRSSEEKLKTNLKKFEKILNRNCINLHELRELSKQGIPIEVRSIVWKLLLGYIPLQKDKRREFVTRRRKRYEQFLDMYYKDIDYSKYGTVLREIDADVPRTFPRGLLSLFEKQCIRDMLRRLLFINAVRQSNRGYWQGLNDVFVPFITTFLSFSLGCEIKDLNRLSEDDLEAAITSFSIEPDTYWCMHNLIANMHHNYIIRTPHIDLDSSLSKMSRLMAVKDGGKLSQHLDDIGVEFVFYGCRWLICLMTREFSMPVVARLWDTYLAFGTSMFTFHQYFCVSYLLSHSSQLLKCDDINKALPLLNNPANDHWDNSHIEVIIRGVDDLIKAEKAFMMSLAVTTVYVVISTFVVSAVVIGLYASFANATNDMKDLIQQQQEKLQKGKEEDQNQQRSSN